MAIREELVLELGRVEDQLRQLESQIDDLSRPIVIPVQVEGDQAIDDLRRNIRAAEADDINVAVDIDGIQEGTAQLDNLGDEAQRAAREIDDVGDAARRADDDIDSIGRRGVSTFRNLAGAAVAFGGALAIGAAARGFISFAGDAIEAASDLEESTSKASVVFGQFSDEIEQFAADAPQALGLANREALEFTATFGNLFVSLGLSQQAAADLSPEIVQLGADLASFNNVPVDEALIALRAGLIGEVEPLRRFGVAINAAAVESKALELGLGGVTGELTEAEKVQARYALILEQTATAQGDFARTADSTANQLKTLRAEFDTFLATTGTLLIPVFQQLIAAAPGVIDALEGFVPVLIDIAEVSGVVALELADLFGAISPAEADMRKFAIQSGFAADSAELLAGALVETGRSAGRSRGPLGLFINETAVVREQLQNILDASEASPQALRIVIANLDFLADQARLTAEETEFLAEILDTRLVQAAQNSQETIDASERGLSGVKRVAEEGIQPTFGEDIEDEAARAEAAIRALDGAMSDVRASFEDEEGEILSDFSAFIDNFIEEAARTRQFEAGLNIVEALFGENAALAFAELGEEALPLLVDALANPAELAQFAGLLEEQVAFGITEGAAAGQEFLDSNPLVANVVAQFDRGRFLQELNDFGADFVLNVPANITGTGGGGSTVTNNFYTQPQPTTDTNRITQTTNQIRS